MAKPDQNQVIRQLPIAAGMVAGLLLFANRLLTVQLTETQSRSDALGVIVCAVLILVGLLWERVQPKVPDSVELSGDECFEFKPELSENLQAELAWASHILLTNTLTRSFILLWDGDVLLRRGILPTESNMIPGTIIKRVIEKQKAIYLVDSNKYPGKIEFNYLPENAQAIICQPIAPKGVLILASNAPRSYTQQDENWITAIAQKLSYVLTQEFDKEIESCD
ncbi:MAG: cofactor assembly of complex C subunit B [Cyanobacteria bacterium]|nr:cofactor assembly of complex C subunit B [Cyanobacteriota bacterium]